MSKAKNAEEAKVFTDIPNVGKATAGDFQQLGFTRPQELAGQDPYALYQRLSALTHTRQDPCVLDVFLAVVEFMEGGAPRDWWEFTEARKKRFPDL